MADDGLKVELPGSLVFGLPGEKGATFTPFLSNDGDLSWSNDKGLENPPTVNIRGPKGRGEDGTSPTITVSDIEGGHRVVITDVNGEQSFDVMDGKDGEDTAGGADWNAAEGEAGHVLNRSHWVERIEIDPSFDNDLTGREVIPLGNEVYLVKITDHVLTEEDCVGAELTIMENGVNTTHTISSNGVVDATDQFGISCFIVFPDAVPGQPFVGVVRQNASVQGMEVSEGTYYLSCAEPDGYVVYTSYFSALNTETTVVHKLDKMFLPDDLDGGVSSWNDLTDKPFGVEQVGEILVPEITLTAPEENPGEFELVAAFTAEAGKTYTVVYNGTEYTCEAVDGSALEPGAVGITVMGNYAAILGTGDTGEPFMIVNYAGQGAMIVDMNGATSITISIVFSGEIIHKLDNKFIDAVWMATAPTTQKDTVVLEETEYELVPITSIHSTCADIPTITLEAKEYIVEYDGVSYVRTCMIDYSAGAGNECYLIGNMYLLNTDRPNTGEPFCIYVHPVINTYVVSGSAGTHTMALYEGIMAVNRLPEEYLPEGYSKNELVAAVIAALPSAEEVRF